MIRQIDSLLLDYLIATAHILFSTRVFPRPNHPIYKTSSTQITSWTHWFHHSHSIQGPDPSPLREELGNTVPAACDIVQHIHIGLIRLSGKILILVKPIKSLIVLLSILLCVIINVSTIIMVLPQILTTLLHLMCHGNHWVEKLGFHQQYGCRYVRGGKEEYKHDS